MKKLSRVEMKNVIGGKHIAADGGGNVCTDCGSGGIMCQANPNGDCSDIGQGIKCGTVTTCCPGA